MIRPLFIAGHIAYYELNIEYITEKFCENKEKPELACNGKCHLAKELSVVESNTDSSLQLGEGTTASLVSECFTPLFYSSLNSFDILTTVPSLIKEDLKTYTKAYSYEEINRILRPPIV